MQSEEFCYLLGALAGGLSCVLALFEVDADVGVQGTVEVALYSQILVADAQQFLEVHRFE